MAGLEGRLLADVEDQEVVRAGRDAPLQIRQSHERYDRGGLGEHLTHSLAAGHVGAQGLGQMGRGRQVQLAHHAGERLALALLEPRVASDLGAQGRALSAFVVMGWEHAELGVELEELSEQAVV